MAELTCVGCGPSDPELLTVKAVKAIKNADVIMCPTAKEGKESIAYSIISNLVDNSKKPAVINLVFPMVKDKDILEDNRKKNTRTIAESVQRATNDVNVTV